MPKLEVKHKHVLERLDQMIYGEKKVEGWQSEAAKEAFEFVEEHAAPATVLIEVVVALLQDHVTEVEQKEKRAAAALRLLYKKMNAVMVEARATYTGK